jgi:hypothetical protein
MTIGGTLGFGPRFPIVWRDYQSEQTLSSIILDFLTFTLDKLFRFVYALSQGEIIWQLNLKLETLVMLLTGVR